MKSQFSFPLFTVGFAFCLQVNTVKSAGLHQRIAPLITNFLSKTVIDPPVEKNYAGNVEHVMRILRIKDLSLIESSEQLINSLQVSSGSVSWGKSTRLHATVAGDIAVPKSASNSHDYQRFKFSSQITFFLDAACIKKSFGRKSCSVTVSNPQLISEVAGSSSSSSSSSGEQKIVEAKLQWLLYDLVNAVAEAKLKKTISAIYDAEVTGKEFLSSSR